MRKIIRTTLLSLLMTAAFVSCEKKVTDSDLLAGATVVLSSYPNAKVEIKDAVAHLSGTFASESQKQEAIDSLKKIKGIEDVHDMAKVIEKEPVEPVEVSSLTPEMMKRVDSAIKDVPGVKAENRDGKLILSGETSAQGARKVKQSVDALNIGAYENTIKVK